MQAAQQPILWISNLRIIAMVGVVALHISADPLYELGHVPMHEWFTANIFDSSVRFSVPVFVMISGALLLAREESPLTFYKKRFLHVLLPFLFWTIVYMGLELSPYYRQGDGSADGSWNWISFCLWNGASYHLWYVYMILGLYLFMPLIGFIVRRCSEIVILVFLTAWLLFLFITRNTETRFSGEYAGYLILGYYLSRKEFANRTLVLWASVLLILGGIAITVMGTYYLSIKNGVISELYYSFLTINVCMVATGVFLLVKHLPTRNLSKLALLLNDYSYGVYLAHVMVLTYLAKVGINSNLIHPAFGIPFTTLLCLGIAVGIIYLLRKVPYGKNVSG